MKMTVEIDFPARGTMPTFPCLALGDDQTLVLFTGLVTGIILNGIKIGEYSDSFIPVNTARWKILQPGSRVTLIVE